MVNPDKSIIQSRIFGSSMASVALSGAASVFTPDEIGIVAFKCLTVAAMVASAAAAFWRSQDHAAAKREAPRNKAMP